MTDLVHIDQRKWPDRRHYQYEVRMLGRDRYGTWVHAPAGTVVRRGDDASFRWEAGGIGLIPEDEWWIAEFFTDHPVITLYVNIGTPPEWEGSRLTQIDLDLDVVRRLDGSVEIIDEDEFEDHRVRLGYPAELIRGARDAADRAARLVRAEVEPFFVASDKWLSQVNAESLRRLED